MPTRTHDPEPSQVPPAVLPGDSESALRCLVLNTMQIDPDRAAPWSLELLVRP